MSRLAFAMLAVAMLHPGFAVAADVAAIAKPGGEYRMQGRGFGANASPYEGTCSLSGQGPTYRVSCYNRDTRHTYSGYGLMNGDTLAITIGDDLRGDHGNLFVGEYLVLYARQPDGAFAGTWIDSRGASGSESLTPLE